MKTIIIGAGIMGMLCARSLANAGHEVLLLEKTSQVGKQASWAGAGMGMPMFPWRYPAPIFAQLFPLIQRAYQLYPHLVQELYTQTQVDSQWYTSGILFLGDEEYAQAALWAYEYNMPLQLLLAAQIQKLEPALALPLAHAIWMPTIAQFRNSRLLNALLKNILQHDNIRILTECEVTDFDQKNNHVTGVQTTQGYLNADEVVVTAGAWSGTLLAQLGKKMDIFPVRGQILLWEAPENLLSSMIVDKQGHYLIPRQDGHILVGSSVEYVGFDNSTTESVYTELYETAISLVPALASYPMVRHWSGLRPGSPEGVPSIGRIPGLDNLWINAGHYRNGLLCGPAANELLINLMQGHDPQVPAALYSPQLENRNA